KVQSLHERWRVEPGEKVGGRDTYLVVGRTQGKPPFRLYFDTETGLLLRQVRYAESPLGRNPTQVDYADYRETGGARLPHRATLRPGNSCTIQIGNVQQKVAVAPEKFTPPPPPPAQP